MLQSENAGTLPLGLVGGREAKKDGAARNIGLFFLKAEKEEELVGQIPFGMQLGNPPLPALRSK
jgi:hypothetical protein